MIRERYERFMVVDFTDVSEMSLHKTAATTTTKTTTHYTDL